MQNVTRYVYTRQVLIPYITNAFYDNDTRSKDHNTQLRRVIIDYYK